MSKLKCRTCQSPMVMSRCESSSRAITCWHQCPLCKQKRLTSESGADSLAGSVQSCSIEQSDTIADSTTDDDAIYSTDYDIAHAQGW